MNKYLVGLGGIEFEDAGVVIMSAQNKMEAAEKYVANVEIRNELFLNYAYSTDCNSGFSGIFYEDNYGEHSFDENGNPRYSPDEIQEIFNKNLKKVFENHEEWQELYWRMTNQQENEEKVVFPDEMLIYIYKYEADLDGILCLDIENEIEEIC